MIPTRCFRTWMIADQIAPKPDYHATRRKKTGKPKPRTFLSSEDKAELRQLRAAGWALAQLAKKFGVSVGTAHRIANSCPSPL